MDYHCCLIARDYELCSHCVLKVSRNDFFRVINISNTTDYSDTRYQITKKVS